MSCYVKALKQSYKWDSERGVAVFPDGIEYTAGELIELSKGGLDPRDMETVRAIHKVKKVFNGEIINSGTSVHPEQRDELHKRNYWNFLMYFSRGKNGNCKKSA